MDTLANTRRRAEKLYLGYAGRRAALKARTPVAQPPAEGEIFTTHDGVRLLLRDIHPDDVQALQRGFAGLTPEEVRFRFLHPLTELPEALARRLCDIDPQHAVALVLIDTPGTREPEIHAVARAFIDPVTLSAEFALIVQHRLAGHGVGTLLMQRLIAACRKLGAVELWGDVLAENSTMLELCEHLGFSRHPAFEDPGVIRVTLPL
ncbi:MAG TPA: GNAT family N-acetyltransferase [Rudaea sp.]|nr:GNAT family N-acetyltransferase [Rudaea sp.]